MKSLRFGYGQLIKVNNKVDLPSGMTEYLIYIGLLGVGCVTGIWTEKFLLL